MMLIIVVLYSIVGAVTATIYKVIQPEEDMDGLQLIIILWPIVVLVGIPMALAYLANYLANKIQKRR
jgi:hypothetical protein